MCNGNMWLCSHVQGSNLLCLQRTTPLAGRSRRNVTKHTLCAPPSAPGWGRDERLQTKSWKMWCWSMNWDRGSCRTTFSPPRPSFLCFTLPPCPSPLVSTAAHPARIPQMKGNLAMCPCADTSPFMSVTSSFISFFPWRAGTPQEMTIMTSCYVRAPSKAGRRRRCRMDGKTARRQNKQRSFLRHPYKDSEMMARPCHVLFLSNPLQNEQK